MSVSVSATRLVALSIACLLALTAVAVAAVDSSVTIRVGNGGQFKGRVKSSVDARASSGAR